MRVHRSSAGRRDTKIAYLSSQQSNDARNVPQVFEQLLPEGLAFLTAELDFFDAVTAISGKLYAVPKDERKAGAVALAKQVRASRRGSPALSASSGALVRQKGALRTMRGRPRSSIL